VLPTAPLRNNGGVFTYHDGMSSRTMSIGLSRIELGAQSDRIQAFHGPGSVGSDNGHPRS